MSKLPPSNIKNFQGRDLTNLDFSERDLRGKDFTGSTLIGANFNNARFGILSYWKIFFSLIGSLVLSLSSLSFIYIGVFIAHNLFFDASNSGNSEPVFRYSAIFTLFSLFFTLKHIYSKGVDIRLGQIFIAASVLTIVAIVCVPGEQEIGVVLLESIIFHFLIFSGSIGLIIVSSLIRTILDDILPAGRTSVLMFVSIGIAVPFSILLRSILFDRINLLLFSLGLILNVVFFSLSISLSKKALDNREGYRLIYIFSRIVSSWKGVSFKGADLTDASFIGADLRNVNFQQAKLTRTCWFNAIRLDRALLFNTFLENSKVRFLATNPEEIVDKDFSDLDLRDLNLQSKDLSYVNFMNSNLSESNLRHTNLSRSNLTQTQLYKAKLSSACLTGAYIQNWGISRETKLDDIQCDYIYMRYPTKDNPDTWRKPDNLEDVFQEGDFEDFIAPVIKTFDMYSPNFDPREVGKKFKTLDFYHHEGLDPVAVIVALEHLVKKYPEAGVELSSLKGTGQDKLQIQATVSDKADCDTLNKEYFKEYNTQVKSPSSYRFKNLQSILEESTFFRGLYTDLNNLSSASQSPKSLLINYNIGNVEKLSTNPMSEQGSININAGGNVSGVVGRDFHGNMNLGTVIGNVSAEINKLPDSSEADSSSLKSLLQQLKNSIESDVELSSEDKIESLEQVEVLAKAGQSNDSNLKKMAKTALKILKGTAASIPSATAFVEACSSLLPEIAKLLVIL